MDPKRPKQLVARTKLADNHVVAKLKILNEITVVFTIDVGTLKTMIQWANIVTIGELEARSLCDRLT